MTHALTPGICDSEDYFRCSSGGCINDMYRCDGNEDCVDNSDEEGCGEFPALTLAKLHKYTKKNKNVCTEIQHAMRSHRQCRLAVSVGASAD